MSNIVNRIILISSNQEIEIFFFILTAKEVRFWSWYREIMLHVYYLFPCLRLRN